MNKDIHKQSLSAALEEVTGLIKQRDNLDGQLERINIRIGELTLAIEGLAPLCDLDANKEYPYLFPDEMEPELGFTDAVRKLMSTKPIEFFSPISLRDKLVESGFDLDKYTNPMASIHTILKRLVKSGAVFAHDDGGRLYYMWNPSYTLRKKLTRRQTRLAKEAPVLDAFSGAGIVVTPAKKSK